MTNADWLTIGIVVLLAAGTLAMLGIAASGAFSRRRGPNRQGAVVIDLAALPPLPPRAEPAGLRFHGFPVRLAFIVAAPQGRASRFALDDSLAQRFEEAIPGIGRVITAESARVVVWPPQLSVQGFCRAINRQFRFPGKLGRNTPWCGMAGRARCGDDSWLLAVIARGDRALPHGLIEIADEADWARGLAVDG